MARADRGGAPAGPTRLVAGGDPYVLFVMGLMSAVARVGSPRLRDAVVAAVSALAFRLSRTKRRGIEATLARAFGPRLGAGRGRAIARGAFREWWLEVFSVVPLRGAPGGDAVSARIVGVEHLERALAEGRGAILWVSNHWAGMAMLKRTLHAHGFPVHKVHEEHHGGGFRTRGDTWVQQRLVTPFFDRHESATLAGIVTIRRGSLAFGRELTGHLRANGIVCLAADGRVGRRFVSQPFLGIAEAFPTGAVALARTSGASLLPAFCLSGARRRMRVVIEAPLSVPAEPDRDASVRRTIAGWVGRLEWHARRHPSRYLNWSRVGVELPATAPPLPDRPDEVG